MPLPIGNLNINLKDVDTSYPSLCVSDHRAIIKKTDFKESSKTPGMWQFVVTLALAEPANDTKGKLLNVGHEFNARLTLPGAPGALPEHEDMRNKQLATFIDAVTGNEDAAARPDFNEAFVNTLPDKQIIAVVKKNKDDSFGETDVKSFKPVIA